MKIKTVKFSDLVEFDNWSPYFWIYMEKYIEIYKKQGWEKSVDYIINSTTNMGEENYNRIADKVRYWGGKSKPHLNNTFTVPTYENAISKKYWKKNTLEKTKLIISLYLINEGKIKRKEELEKEINRLTELLKNVEETNDFDMN
jgi:hypothetical protein